MHETYWGFSESPFRSANQLKYFYASPTHDEALARLQFLVQERRTLGVLSGVDGMGKSLVLRAFARDLRQSGRVLCHVNLLGADVRSFHWSLASLLGTGPRPEEDAFALGLRVADGLREAHYHGTTSVLLLDDADQASHEVLMQVLRLLKTHEGSVTALLAVEDSRAGRLGGDLLQMSDLRIRLEPWETHDVRDYLRTSLEKAGCAREVFDEVAAARLQELTDGVPRWVAQLAELALVAGAGQQLETIDADTVESVYHELSMPRREPALAGVR